MEDRGGGLRPRRPRSPNWAVGGKPFQTKGLGYCTPLSFYLPHSPRCPEGISLLRKSLSAWSVAHNRSNIPKNQGQNTTKTGFQAPERGSENGTKEFFNPLGCSANFALTEFSAVRKESLEKYCI